MISGLSISYRKSMIAISEQWYSASAAPKSIDVVLYRQFEAPVKGTTSREKHTILVNLDLNEDELFSQLKKDCRNQVRRAERDGVECRWLDARSTETRSVLFEFYNRFAAKKRLANIDPYRFQKLADAGLLLISVAATPADGILVAHVYVVSQCRARLLYSASELKERRNGDWRNSVGRANRLLHWVDLRELKALGFRVYDFGGWYPGKSSVEKIGINRFKEEFGGERAVEYDGEFGQTIVGKLALAMLTLRR